MFVYRKTIWNKVGSGFSNPNQSKVFKIGKHKVLLSRSARLDRYGNPVHTATLIKSNGQVGNSYRSNGNATLVVSKMFVKNGIGVRYSKNPYKRKG